MSRRKRESESDLVESAMASDIQGNSRIELDDLLSSSVRSSRYRQSIIHVADPTMVRPESLAFQAAAEPLVQTQTHRTRSVSRSSGNASGSGNLGSSSQRRQSSNSRRDQNETASPALARQSLTSSASALRPSKQRGERNHLLSRAHVQRHVQLDQPNSDNNNYELGGNDADDGYGGSQSNNYEFPGGATDGSFGGEWKYDKAGNVVRAAPLPSRTRLHQNSPCDSRSDDRSEETTRTSRDQKTARISLASSSATIAAPSDRPPSRQRHAFPTHLIDTNAFGSQPPVRIDSNRGSSRGSNRGMRDKSVHRANANSPPDSATSKRPPSRYMTKAKRNSVSSVNKSSKVAGSQSPQASASSTEAASDSQSTSNRQLSRRCVDSVHSLNQVNHDPITDGFADVDESVPPPFRIEITTDSYHTVAPRQSQRVPPSSKDQGDVYAARNSLQSRRRSSFGNQEQLRQHMALASDEEQGHTFAGITDRTSRGKKKSLEWFDHDDQINNAHLFETVAHGFDDDFDPGCAADECSSSKSSSPSSSSPLGKSALHASDSVRSNCGPSTTAVPPTRGVSSSGKQLNQQLISDQQWVLASTNPFFYTASPAQSSEFDDMDPETAIAQTPLYSSDDLMTIATEMSDLHLDDFIVGDLQPMPLSIAVESGRSGVGSELETREGAAKGGGYSTSSRSLHTSLGKDFLSLFAQH